MPFFIFALKKEKLERILIVKSDAFDDAWKLAESVKQRYEPCWLELVCVMGEDLEYAIVSIVPSDFD